MTEQELYEEIDNRFKYNEFDSFDKEKTNYLLSSEYKKNELILKSSACYKQHDDQIAKRKDQ